MTHVRTSLLVAIAAAGAAAASAAALQLPSIPGMGGLTNISKMGMGNAAGVLSYCTKNSLLGGSSGATSVMNSLTKKPGVSGSKDFMAGQAGNILTGGKGQGFSLASASDPVKSQACNMVLKQAKKFH